MKVSTLLYPLLSLSVSLAAAASPDQQAADKSPFAGKNLRILPLGASITFGLHSTDGNGYREHLKKMLTGANVEYIGSQCSGNMENGNNEGHPGHLIGNMMGYATPDLPEEPNVVLIYVGTNDMLYPVDPTKAPERMADLVDGLAKKLPKTLFLVGNLFLETDPTVQKRIDTFNAALPKALEPLTKKGVNVQLADFSKALEKSDLHCDGEHPNDSGYEKMAKVFSSGLAKAASATKIPDAAKATATGHACKPIKPTPTGTCAPTTTTTKAPAANQPTAS